MADRIHLEIKRTNIEVWFGIVDGGKEEPCYYCDKPGHEQLVEIDMMYSDAQLLPRNHELYALAREEAKLMLNHGRAVCHSAYREKSPCRNLFNRDMRRKN